MKLNLKTFTNLRSSVLDFVTHKNLLYGAINATSTKPSVQIDRIFIVMLQFFLSYILSFFLWGLAFSIWTSTFILTSAFLLGKYAVGRKIRNNNKSQITVPYVLFYISHSIYSLYEWRELNLIFGIELWRSLPIRYIISYHGWLTAIKTEKKNIFHLIDEKSNKIESIY